jgi:hypothetical protein
MLSDLTRNWRATAECPPPTDGVDKKIARCRRFRSELTARAARLLPARTVRAPSKTTERAVCRQIVRAGATGLEPATSGVTGRSWHFRHERGSAGIPGRSRPFSPAHCGDRRVPAGIPGSLVRDQRGMSRCLIRKHVGRRSVESSGGGLEPSTPSLPCCPNRKRMRSDASGCEYLSAI